MEYEKFKEYAMNPDDPKWETAVKRRDYLYTRPDDIRSEFERDYTRILHSRAYSRLKHKTQVFFATENDHICTRIEHVNHVASISRTIAKYLGLNMELVNTIATGHDIGHAPFGHTGERILNAIAKRALGSSFWHEKNSLRFADECETLKNKDGFELNMNLTYAVRDGIISHCGEVNDNRIKPRNLNINLETINVPSQFSPYTWEGCVVKIADNIAYIGRDLEDALRLGILGNKEMNELEKIIKSYPEAQISKSTNTSLIHSFVTDLCRSSDPETGLGFSKKYFELMEAIKEFNYKYIYKNIRLTFFHEYAKLIINSIYDILVSFYKLDKTIEFIEEKYLSIYPVLSSNFKNWLIKFSHESGWDRPSCYKNRKIYDLKNKNDYIQAIIDFISGMTDSFAIKIFNEIIRL